MAVLDHIIPSSSNLLSRIGVALSGFAINFSEARSRSAAVQYYSAMSDEALAAQGLRRDEIVRHVFRDHISF